MSLEDNNFVWIEVDPGLGEHEVSRASFTDHETQTSHLDEIRVEPDWTIENSKFDENNENVARAGLYVNHIVKEEIVLGPEVIGQPKVPPLPYPEYRAATSPILPIWPKSNGEETFYKCYACRKTFDLEESFSRHMFAIHAKHELSEMSKMHICKFCCQIFASKNCLSKHLKIHYENSKSAKAINNKRGMNLDKIISAELDYERNKALCSEDDCPPSNPYTCHACHISFYQEKWFDEHMLDYHAEPLFQEELTIVQCLDGTPPYKCQTCHKTFDSVESLTRHRFAVHAREPSRQEIDRGSFMRRCYFCYQLFENQDDLIKHMAFHIEFASEIND